MKVRFYFSALCALVVLSAFSTMKAQSPDQQMGFGVSLGTGATEESVLSAPIGSGTVAYAINPGMHIGAGFGLGISSRSANGISVSSNSLLFAPYFKALLKGSKDFVPFIMGQFVIASRPTEINPKVSNTSTSLNVLGGAEYFASKNLGIYGSLSVLELGFDPSRTAFGIGISANIGIEWFM